MRPNARRCLVCGTQVPVSTEPADPEVAAREKRARLLRKYGLSEMQKKILSAAAIGGEEIYVVGNDKLAQGEVKSGQERFYGNDAVAAVAGLVAPGLISPQGEDCFRLTPDGALVAETLQIESV